MLDRLYEDIGTKIKGWAKVIFVVEALGAIISGIVLMCDEAFLAGLLTALLGPVVAWVSSWILYGFGELVEKTVSNAENTGKLLRLMEKTDCRPAAPESVTEAAPAPTVPVEAAPEKAAPVKAAPETHSWRCDRCGKMIAQYPCAHCGYKPDEAESTWWCSSCGKRNLASRDTCWSCGTEKQK